MVRPCTCRSVVAASRCATIGARTPLRALLCTHASFELPLCLSRRFLRTSPAGRNRAPSCPSAPDHHCPAAISRTTLMPQFISPLTAVDRALFRRRRVRPMPHRSSVFDVLIASPRRCRDEERSRARDRARVERDRCAAPEDGLPADSVTKPCGTQKWRSSLRIWTKRLFEVVSGPAESPSFGRASAPIQRSAGGSIEELRRRTAADKPAMVYFSTAQGDAEQFLPIRTVQAPAGMERAADRGTKRICRNLQGPR